MPGHPCGVHVSMSHMCMSSRLFMQETVADELEEHYKSNVWDPSLRHVQKQKQGVTAARLEFTSLTIKVWLQYLADCFHVSVHICVCVALAVSL